MEIIGTKPVHIKVLVHQNGPALWPERFDGGDLARIQKTLGSYVFTALYQQQPAPPGGGLFKREWFAGKVVDAVPRQYNADPFEARLIIDRCRSWDFAASESDSADYTVGARLAKVLNPGTGSVSYYVEDVVRGRWGPKAGDEILFQATQMDGIDCEVCIEEEGGSAGKKVSAAVVQLLAGYSVHAERSTGSKWARARAFATQCEAGNVFLVRGEWNAEFLDELAGFDHAKHDDQVDASASGFNRLAFGAQAGVWGPDPTAPSRRPLRRRGSLGPTWR